ncbi:DUF1538 family protein [Aerococcus viridans]
MMAGALAQQQQALVVSVSSGFGFMLALGMVRILRDSNLRYNFTIIYLLNGLNSNLDRLAIGLRLSPLQQKNLGPTSAIVSKILFTLFSLRPTIATCAPSLAYKIAIVSPFLKPHQKSMQGCRLISP